MCGYVLGTACILLTGVASVPPSRQASNAIVVDERLQELITDITRRVIPRDFVDNKKWNRQKELVRGLYVRRDGLRIKTHRTKKLVNHGTWTRYRIELIDPDQQLHVQIDNVHRSADQRTAFTITCDARLRVTGRLAQWRQGVQLISLSAEAETDVRLILDCDIATRLDFSQLPPAIEIDPAVQAAKLELKQFRVNHISRIKGDLAHRLSASVREVVERELERRNAKLLAKINRQLEKKRDKFRLSLQATLPSVFLRGAKTAADDLETGTNSE